MTPRAPARRRLQSLRVLVFAVAIALLVYVFANVEWHATYHAITGAGVAVALAIVPFGIALVVDATGMLIIARAARIELSAGAALVVRVVSEALHFGAPGGVVASEAAAVTLLARTGIPAEKALLLTAGRKWLVMRAHAIYLAMGACIGASALAVIGQAVHTRAPLRALVLASAIVPLVLSVALGLTMRRSSRAKRFASVRACVARLLRARQWTALGTAVFLCAWLVEATETAVILRLVGAPMSMASVVAIEGVLSLARSAVAFVPGGLGVQDVGYASALGALGATHETAAAFVLLKRAKEITWIAIGFAVNAIASARKPASAATRPVPA